MFFQSHKRSRQTLTYDEYVQRSEGQRRRAVGYLTVQIKRKDSNEWTILCKDKHNLGTLAGQDLLHRVMYINTGAESSGWGANYIALSVSATAPATSHQSLASDTPAVTTNEITINGLARIVAVTKTHSGGTNTSTIEHTFTASGTHTNVQLTGLFNNTVASGSSILAHENTFTATSLASGDELKVTWTITSTF
jgi:hypothetical protein